MESFFEKLNASKPPEDSVLYPFETDILESELSYNLIETTPIKSSTGLQSIRIPIGCEQTFEAIDDTCTLRFKSKNEDEPMDGCILVSPIPQYDKDTIFHKDTVNAIIWQMTEGDSDAIDYEVHEISKVIKNREQGIFLDYSIAYDDDAVVRNLQYVTIKNQQYIIATVSIPEQLTEKLAPAAFTSALSMIV